MEKNNIPQIDLNLDDIDTGNVITEKKEQTTDVISEEPIPIEEDIANASADADGDENDIVVSDRRSPIVMLFGPRSSGKSMTLVRLARYLRDKGYTISTDFTFKSIPDYHEKCDRFMEYLDTKDALPGTAYTDFLLLKVSFHGRTICQFLEAPGEHYFDQANINAENFPHYMTHIIRSLNNRKIWVFIAEAKWNINQKTRTAYINRIRMCLRQLVKPLDSSLILYNKIDKREELFESGRLINSAAETIMREEYGGLADLFKNTNPITSLWRRFNYKFVPFCTGYYSKSGNRLSYSPSEDMYPELLWRSLLKCVRG